MKYNNQYFIEKYNQNEKIKFLFFWGHQLSKDGRVTQSCFSQWWLSPFIADGITYKTAEHWMMAGKARLFKDAVVFEKIIDCKTPAEAKKLGRQVANFDPAVWDSEKYALVLQGNLYKFSQHEELKDFLLNTNDRVLVEASPVDKIWGIGMAATHTDIENPVRWNGQNLLGYALMEVRDQLR